MPLSAIRDQLNLLQPKSVIIFTIELYVKHTYYAYSADSTGYLHLSDKAGHQASKGVDDYYNASFLSVSCSNCSCYIQGDSLILQSDIQTE